MESTPHGKKEEALIRRQEKPSAAPIMPVKKKSRFDPWKFLATIGEGRKFLLFQKKQAIFTQGDTADAVFYIQTGKVRLTVVSQDWQGSNHRHIK